MREYIVLAKKDHYNHLGIVRTLGEAGISPVLVTVDSPPRMAAASKYVKKVHYVDALAGGVQLILSQYAKSKTEKSFILTGDDVSVSLLDAHYEELKDYFYFFNAGEAGRVQKYMNKDEVCALAVRHGFNIPKTWRVRNGEIPEDIEYPVITKALNSFGKEWKDIVYICDGPQQLHGAYSRIKSDTIILQKYIEKSDEKDYEGFSVDRGRDVFICMETTQVYSVEGKYSPYLYCRNFDDDAVLEKIRGMLSEIGFEGVFEFEFLVGTDGKLYFLEINLRNTVVGYATTVAGMPGITLWCAAMVKGRIDNNCYRVIPEGFTSMAECYDYDLRVKNGVITRKEWMRQYKSSNAKLYRGRHDFNPFFSFMWYKLTKMRQ